MSPVATRGPGVAVAARGLTKVFPGGRRAVDDIDVEIGAGELLVLLGPSGSGKTTLLRLLAGLEIPDAGTIAFDGRDVTALPPYRRDVGMAFQVPALYPHLTVFENLAFGLRARGVPGPAVRARVAEVAAILDVGDLLDRRPATLSGGQQQRVGLGRAVARRPPVCLFDEPLAALDAPLRASARRALAALHATTGATFVHVTHDQAEAMALADRIALLREGRLVQVGGPRDLHDRPASRFVGEFLGSPPMNILRGRIAHEDGRGPTFSSDAWPGEPLPLGSDRADLPVGTIDLGVRPEHVALATPEQVRAPELAWLAAAVPVVRREDQGHEVIVEVGRPPEAVRARRPASCRLRPGDLVSVGLELRRASWFDAGTGRAFRPDAP